MMIELKRMKSTDIDRIAEIDRTEHVTLGYFFRDGRLDAEEVDWQVPRWFADGPEHSVFRKESAKLVWEGLNGLTSDIRLAVILRDIQGKSYEEIAEVLELPLGTVKSRINRGRLQLATILKEKKERKNGV